MRLRFVGIVLIVTAVFASAALRAATMRDPGSCPNDSKLIGQVSVWGDEFENSVWRLIVDGMVAAGLLTDTAQRDYLNGLYGTSYETLAGVRQFDLQGVSDAFDKNGNGLICVFDLRGTRAYNDDPYFDYTWFGASDDKIRK
jgi:hypothetical protein